MGFEREKGRNENERKEKEEECGELRRIEKEKGRIITLTLFFP